MKTVLILFLCLSSLAAAKKKDYALELSQRGIDLIIKYEVSGRSYYDRYLQRPTVPAWRTTASGVTVGFGYDVGHTSKDRIQRDWQGIIPQSMIDKLKSVQGLKGRRAYYANKNIRSYVRISWSQAELQFKKSTLPRFTKLTKSAFDIDRGELHPHVNSALTSVVFNRGSSMGRTNRPDAWDSRMEMRWIKYNISIKAYDRIPGNIRHMKRLWSYAKLRGLHLRRDAEAALAALGVQLM